MSFFKEVCDRIRYATNARTQIELAEVLDIRQSSISDAKRRDSIPSDWIVKLFEKYGLNPDWIKKGVGPMYLRTEQGYTPMEAPQSGVKEDPAMFGDPLAKNGLVRVFDMLCAYDEQTVVPQLEPIGKIVLPQAFLGNNITVLQAASDAMAPIIRKGAHVGIDTTPEALVSGEIYAVFMPHEGLTFKRVFFAPQQQQFVLRVDTPDYPEANLAPEEYEKRIYGRVCWTLQRI